MQLTVRRFDTGSWAQIQLDGPTIASVRTVEGPTHPDPADEWVAPAFWDIQTNGRWGVSFSDPAITVEQVAQIVRAHAALGAARLCPTLITASFEATRHGVRAIAEACSRFPDVAAMVLGIHLEGPFISPIDGSRGAHPLSCVRDPDWDEFQVWQDACGGRIILMTLAPERPGAIPFIRRATAAGVVIAIGHTAADPAAIHAAADAGATLSTHLGNGIAAQLPRHPNAIFAQAAEDRLYASLIADGHHLDGDTLKCLFRAKGAERVILVSDASPLAGLEPGNYGEWAVDPSGRIVVAGTPYLAGSNQPLEVGVNNLLAVTGCGLAAALDTVTRNPARLLGRPRPAIAPGEPASLVLFNWSATRRALSLCRTLVDGALAPGHADAPE
jgi:N-acetylglucosamine-6-phosphate deacetylase